MTYLLLSSYHINPISSKVTLFFSKMLRPSTVRRIYKLSKINCSVTRNSRSKKPMWYNWWSSYWGPNIFCSHQELPPHYTGVLCRLIQTSLKKCRDRPHDDRGLPIPTVLTTTCKMVRVPPGCCLWRVRWLYLSGLQLYRTFSKSFVQICKRFSLHIIPPTFRGERRVSTPWGSGEW